MSPDQVCEEVHSVYKWFQLGRCLSLRVKDLLALQRTYQDVDECRTRMICKWFNQEKPTWRKLVYALVKMDEISLAVYIANGHGKYKQDFISVTVKSD